MRRRPEWLYLTRDSRGYRLWFGARPVWRPYAPYGGEWVGPVVRRDEATGNVIRAEPIAKGCAYGTQRFMGWRLPCGRLGRCVVDLIRRPGRNPGWRSLTASRDT
jgi:hypothetical protein